MMMCKWLPADDTVLQMIVIHLLSLSKMLYEGLQDAAAAVTGKYRLILNFTIGGDMFVYRPVHTPS